MFLIFPLGNVPKIKKIALNTLFVGKNFVELPSVDSTNSFAQELLPTRPADGTVIFSSHQFAGRGQQGSSWLGAPGQNIALSVILYPYFLLADRAFSLSKVVALAVRDAVQHFLPDALVEVKWPNDILVNRRKIAGILLENQLQGNTLSSAIVGIGINVNQIDFPGTGYGQPTSLSAVAEHPFDLHTVLDEVLARLEQRYLGLRAGKIDRLEYDYLHALYGYQERICVEIQGIEMEVMPLGVDPQGRLVVEDGGKLRYFGLKEISFVI
jgi:BirA family transcriptional regulator, biotin operon repressor / biotin---[acetyl-CoA-carboxylase] ligase